MILTKNSVLSVYRIQMSQVQNSGEEKIRREGGGEI